VPTTCQGSTSCSQPTALMNLLNSSQS